MNDQDRFHHEVMAQLEQDDIVTSYVYPPIPCRKTDWQATRSSYEPGDRMGWGATEQEAMQDLIEQEQS